MHQPPYASCVFFEMYKDATDESPYVQIFYRNSTKLAHMPPLEIPGCGMKCPLTELYKLYYDVLPIKSFEEECALRDGETLPLSGNPENNSL